MSWLEIAVLKQLPYHYILLICVLFYLLPVMPRQDGKVAIVTGGGKGIGFEVVRHMARLGAHVIIGTVWKAQHNWCTSQI